MIFLVEFNNDITVAQIQQWFDDNQIQSYTKLSEMGTYVVQHDTAPVKTDIISAITADTNISTQLMGEVEIIANTANQTSSFSHDDTNWWKMSTVFEMDHDAQSTDFKRLGAKTIVYMVDSGIDKSHPEFANAKIDDLFTFNDNFKDTNGHGTALASLIVGETLGVTDATVKSVKIFDDTKSTMISDLVSALDAIRTDIINNPTSVAIVNMSWAIPKNEYVESKIQLLINAGAIVVAASGNSGIEIVNTTPASMANVLTIGAYDMDFNPASFSNYSAISNTHGDTNYGVLDGWAPGVDIRVALVGGQVGLSSGTSAAAAIMSACLAHNSDLVYSMTSKTLMSSEYLQAFSLQKEGLIHLADSKYVGSVNKVASFLTSVFSQAETGSYSATRVVYAGQEASGLVAYSAYTDKIELDGILPEGLSLSNGWIVGTITSPPEVSTTLAYKVTITFKSGIVKTYDLKLILVNAQTSPGDKPADIELLICRSTGNYGCGGTCTGFCQACTKTSCTCGAVC